jgi:phage terminase small subunit
MAKIESPPGLNARALRVWRQVVPDRARTIERQLLIGEALAMLSRADAIAAEIERAGLVLTSKRSKMTHLNPMVAMELRLRARFAALWRALGLDNDGTIFLTDADMRRDHERAM